jgi:hypothetical protein
MDITYYNIFLFLSVMVSFSVISTYYLWRKVKTLEGKYERLSGKNSETRNYVKQLYEYLQTYWR